MKKFKIKRGIQIILITLLVIIIGWITVENIFKNKVSAFEDGSPCGKCDYGVAILAGEFTGLGTGKGYHAQKLVCDQGCGWSGYDATTRVKCTKLDNWKPSTTVKNTHARYCMECYNAAEIGSCYDNNDDGYCDVCGGELDSSGGGNGGDGSCDGTHPDTYWVYYPKTDELHKRYYKCSGCGEEWYDCDVIHQISYSSDGNSTHTATCSQCGYRGMTENHRGANHEDGRCTVCQEVYEIHGQAEDVKEYVKTEIGHTPIYECKHEGCEIIYEGQEETHNYVEGVCTICGQEDTREIDITSDKYEIDDKYISKVQPETTVGELKDDLETNATEIKIYNKDNQLVNDDKNVGTGMKVQFKLGDTTKEFTIIVNGDVDGDGNTEMSDMSIVNRYRLGKKDLEEIYIRAADVTGDGEVDFKDLTKLNRYRLSKITEL